MATTARRQQQCGCQYITQPQPQTTGQWIYVGVPHQPSAGAPMGTYDGMTDPHPVPENIAMGNIHVTRSENDRIAQEMDQLAEDRITGQIATPQLGSGPLPETITSPLYIPGFLTTQIGSLVRVVFLIGTNTEDRTGVLEVVGASYIILRQAGGIRMLCDLFSIKFVSIVGHVSAECVVIP